MRDHLILASLAALVMLDSQALHAQEVDTRPAAHLTVGVAYQGGIFGDDHPLSNAKTAMIIGGQVSKRLSRSKALVFEGTLQPVTLENPHFDEGVNVLNLQFGPELGHRIYVRPSGGVAVRLWSGSRSVGGMDFAPAIGVATGYRRSIAAGLELSSEFFARASPPVDGVFTWLAGVQVRVGPRR